MLKGLQDQLRELRGGALDAKGKGKGKYVCHDMCDTGKCEFGDRCKFSHDPEDIALAEGGLRTDKRKKKTIQ